MKTDLIDRVRHEGNPLIDGTRAMWVWRGVRAPQLIGDFNRWSLDAPLELREIAPRVWTAALDFPRDAYIEYAFVRGGQHVVDPFSWQRVPNGLGSINHFFYMPEATATTLIKPIKGLPRGTVTRHAITSDLVAGGKRTVYLFQPPVTEPCPLLIVFDGEDYLKRVHLPHIIDNLIGLEKMRPVAVAFIENRTSARIAELASSETMLAFVLKEVLPLAQAELNLTAPGDWGLLGASLGGLMSVYAALRFPEIFNRVLSQSGSFAMRGHASLVFDLVRSRYNPQVKVWLDVGRYEPLLEANLRLAETLRANDSAVTYREYNGGHNYTAWRDEVEHGLIALYGN
ncbi:MAG TPA: alpha/beta hydrolase-fold protein [Anaerolineae bacterium]|nr:alpha/beta hydrolase-fold protein [Anaerolineae bacterium]